MRITEESEWMKSQKHADVMAPDKDFAVLQTHDGNSVFFSLGTDGVFYVTREVQSTSSGWTRTDLSSRLQSSLGRTTIRVKTFSVSQNANSLSIDLAMVVTAASRDYLYLSLGNPNTDAAWAAGVIWTNIPYDADPRATVAVADVFLLNVAGTRSAQQACVVDIWRAAGINDSLDRYYINPTGAPRWIKHSLAIDLDAGSISTCLGQRKQDLCPGIYTLGTIDATSELIYVPTYNVFRPTRPAPPVRLALPPGARSMAAALNANSRSNLFISSSNGIGLYPYDAQLDQAACISISTSPLVANASELSAATAGGVSSVWGVDAQGGLFYLTCAAGQESTPSAWSVPVVLAEHVEGYAFFTNINSGHHTLFAHVNGQDMVQFVQDPVTTDWHQRRILLPATTINDMVEFNGFHTRVEIRDDLGISQAQIQVAINSTSPVSVYINDVYFVLSPTYSANIKTDSAGALTIIQPTDTLAVVPYRITLLSPNSGTLVVNPAIKAMQTLANIKSASDLSAVQITDASGNKRSLVSDKISVADKAAAVSALTQFVSIGATLPADGSRQQTANDAASPLAVKLASRNSVATTGFALHLKTSDFPKLGFSMASSGFGSSAVPAVNGEKSDSDGSPASVTAVNGNGDSCGATNGNKQVMPVKRAIMREVSTSGFESALVPVGDFFRMLGHEMASKLDSLVVKVVDGFHYVTCKISGVLYHAILDCISAISHAIEWVLSKIELLAEDLVSWLGFVFGWSDIVRTHRVLKTMMKQYALKAVASITSIESAVSSSLDGMEEKLNAATSITDAGITIGSRLSKCEGESSPQAHWGHEHMKNNIHNATYSVTSALATGFEGILDDLKSLCVDEVLVIKNMMNQIREQLIKPYPQLTLTEVVKRLIGIIGDFVLKTARNIVVKVMDIIKIIVKTVLDILDAPINIPIISPTYKAIAKEDLSFLDLMCLVMAIPTTIMYKVAVGKAPFPDNMSTNKLINASSFEAFSNVVMGPSPQSVHVDLGTVPQKNNMTIMVKNLRAPVVSRLALNSWQSETLDTLLIIAQFVKVGVSWYSMIQNDIAYVNKQLDPPDEPPTWKDYLKMVGFLVGSVGTIVNTIMKRPEWPYIMGDTLTTLGFLKSAIDVPLKTNQTYREDVSHIIAIVISVTSLVPACGILALEHNKASDSVDFTHSVITQASKITSEVALSKMTEVPEDAVILIAANAASLVGGMLGFANAGLVIAKC